MKLSEKIRNLRWVVLAAACVLSTAIGAAPAPGATFLAAWGSNYDGQLGDGTTANHNLPTAVDTSGVLAGKTLTAISGGAAFTLALASNGRVYGWGGNEYGQLGNGTTKSSTVPVAVNRSGVLAGKIVIAIGTGWYHCVALASDGRVYAWGWNNYGQLGDGTTTNRYRPVAVDTSGVLAGKTITAVSANYGSTMALTSDGEIYAWGWNANGNLGDGTTTDRRVPVAVKMDGALVGKTVTAISAGSGHSLALTSDGRVYAWGAGLAGVGDGTHNPRRVPVAVDRSGVLAGKTITAISCGNDYSLALDSAGRVYSWGGNQHGELGDGTLNFYESPVAVKMDGALAGKTVISISAGIGHALAITSDGRVYAWGNDSAGQLGTGSYYTSNYAPVAVSLWGVLGSSAIAVSAGGNHSLALASGAPCPAIALSSQNRLTKSTIGRSYKRIITPSGGAAPYSFRLVTGALPPGLTLSKAGVLSGTFTIRGKFSFTVEAADANGCLNGMSYAFEICPLITLSPDTLAAGQVGISYGQTLTASGGIAPYAFRIGTGTSLPSGLTLSSNGALAGTTSTAGDFTFAVRATDAGGCGRTKTYTLHINP